MVEASRPEPHGPAEESLSRPPAPADGAGDRALDQREKQDELDELRSRNAKLAAQVDELKALAASPPESPKDIQRLHLLQIQPVRDLLVILLVVGLFWVGYILRPVTIPLLVALGLAYLVEPLVRRLT